MSLHPGTRVGPYEVTAQIGAGGMGEVYRATDTNLGRQVAIKVIPDAFAQDPERLARFEREAKTLAALNHPNIAIIHGFEKTKEVAALVMELVDGATLADRMAHGPIPIDEALPIAKQIAEALEVAHEQGIIHRDLKPANIKIRPDGTVKVLDFGLAKAMEPAAGSSANLSKSPTLTTPAMTAAGMILGTAAYMSPEQARGRTVDKRADIWAFGVVLFEMLTGRRAFDGATVSETLAEVIKSPPAWDTLSATVPARVRWLLKGCLEKDARLRVRDIGDARMVLEGTFPGAMEQVSDVRSTSVSRRTVPWVAGLIAGAISTAVAFWSIRPAPAVERAVRFSMVLPATDEFPIETGLPISVAVSPDGERIVYSARRNGVTRLYSRRVDELTAEPILGTDGALGPFFSPDGAWLGFYADGALRKLSLAGGTPVTIASAAGVTGATWSSNGEIIFAAWQTPLSVVSESGGNPRLLTSLESGATAHYFPHALPDGRAALFATRDRIQTVELATGDRRTIIEGSNPYYVDTGQLVFSRGDKVLSVRFDLATRSIVGAPVVVLENVDSRRDAALDKTNFAAARNGTLVAVPTLQPSAGRLVWVDRRGQTRSITTERKFFSHPRLSPDGRRLAVGVRRDDTQEEVWLYDADRGTGARLIAPPATRAIWTPDGSSLTFQRRGQLYRMSAAGIGEPELTLEQSGFVLFPLAWASRGKLLAYSAVDQQTSRNVWLLPDSGKPVPFLNSEADERAAMFSPDARWMVYARRDQGSSEQVYIQPIDGSGPRALISVDGGMQPVWSPTGGEIFYRSMNRRRLLSVDVRTSPTLALGTPTALFDGDFPDTNGGFWANYDVSQDGQRFVMVDRDDASDTRQQLHVILHGLPVREK